MDLTILKAAFNDELEKIAGSLQGFVRSGKRPISAGRLLEKETTNREMKKKKAVITKIAAPSLKGQALRAGLALGAGASLYKAMHTANNDRKLGKAVRMQQQGQ